jgi:hypothetical protein
MLLIGRPIAGSRCVHTRLCVYFYFATDLHACMVHLVASFPGPLRHPTNLDTSVLAHLIFSCNALTWDGPTTEVVLHLATTHGSLLLLLSW